MNKLLMSRQKKSIAWFLAIAVVMVYSLPISIFADEKMKQKEAEAVSLGGTCVYDGAGKLISGDTDLKTSATGVVALSKKITKLPTKENPNQFEITLEFKTKPEVKAVKEEKDTAVVLVVDVSSSMRNYISDSDYGIRLDKARETLKKFLDDYSKMGSGGKRMVSLIQFGTDAKVISNWTDVSNPDKLQGINNIVAVLGNEVGMDDGGTNLEGALKLANYVIKSDEIKDIEKDLKYVAVLTDGVPTINLGSFNASNLTVTGDPWTPTHAIWDSTEKREKIGIATLENRVDNIQREMEELNREANTSIFLFSKDMQGEMVIYKNEISKINRIKRYYEIKGSGSITKAQADQLAEELKNNKDKEFSLNSYHEYKNMPAGIVMIPNSREPYYGGYDSNLFWETEDRDFMSGKLKKDWYEDFAHFNKVASANSGVEIDTEYEKLYKEIKKVSEPMPEFDFVDPMGDYIAFLDSADRKMDYVLKGNFSVGTKDGDITTYTRKYNVVLATDKDGFVDGKHYKTNGITTVTYKYPDQSDTSKLNEYTVKFPVPEVRGYKSVKTEGGGGKHPKPDPKPEEPKPEQPKEDPKPEEPKPTPTPEITPAPEPAPNPTPVPNPDPENPRPAYPRNNIPDANDPNSPDEITIIDENGVPLGNYEKKTNPDGTMEYVIVDEDVPLGGLLPITGGYGVIAVVGFGGLLTLTGILLGRKKYE